MILKKCCSSNIDELYLHWKSRVLACTDGCCSIIESVFLVTLIPHDGHFKENTHKEEWCSLQTKKKNQDGINTYHYVLYIKLFIYLYPEGWGYCFRSMPPLNVSINVRNLYCLASKIGFLMMQRTISLMLIRVMRQRA